MLRHTLDSMERLQMKSLTWAEGKEGAKGKEERCF
jgi:hypothetical protein